MHLKTSDLSLLKLGFGDYTCNWGTHFCGLYETKAERDEIMFGFLARGFEQGELCICCPEESHFDHAMDDLHVLCPSCARPTPESVLLLHSQELYHPKGYFSPNDMLDAHEAIWAKNLAAGSKNVRGTADMSWAIEKIPGVEHLMAYESLLNTFIWGKTWISICMYNVNLFPGSLIMKVLQVHPFVITGGGVFENPYFVPPVKWLGRNAPELLQRTEHTT